MLEGLKRLYYKFVRTNATPAVTAPEAVPIPGLDNEQFSPLFRLSALKAGTDPEKMRAQLLESIDRSLDSLELGLAIGLTDDEPTQDDPGDDHEPKRELAPVLKALSSDYKTNADLLAQKASLCWHISANDLAESLIRLTALMYDAREFFLEQYADCEGATPSAEAAQTWLELRDRLAGRIRSARGELVSYRSESESEAPASGGPD